MYYIFCCTFIQISIALTLIHKQYSWNYLLLIFFIVNIFAFSPREDECQKKSFCCYMLMTRISKVTTITFWVTHQYSAMPENKYSLKHASFLHDLGKLQRLHENRVCSHTSSRPFCEMAVLLHGLQSHRKGRQYSLIFCILHLLLEPMQQSLYTKCFSSLALVVPELYKGQTCREKKEK